jgi:hypothetical protein
MRPAPTERKYVIDVPITFLNPLFAPSAFDPSGSSDLPVKSQDALRISNGAG